MPCEVFLDLIDLYGQRCWFELCKIEPTLFNATLAFTAILWLNVNPTLNASMRQEGMFRKGETIKAANSLVRESQVNDILIAAVAKLSQLAVSNHSSVAQPHGCRSNEDSTGSGRFI